jgi:hypothetical protein
VLFAISLGITCFSASLESFRIPWRKVLDVGIDIELDLEAEHTAAFALERWFRNIVEWDKLDLSDPERPRLRCAVDELMKLPVRSGKSYRRRA